LRPSGHVEVEGDVQVRHLRTGATQSIHCRLVTEQPGSPAQLEIDGQPAPNPSPPVREALLDLAACRAAGLLPAPNEELLVRLAWIGREARELGAPLPSPVPEALRGGGRALVQNLLAQPPLSPRRAVRALYEALTAARATGLARDDLADLRQELDQRLTYYAGWALSAGGPDAVSELAETVDATRRAAGDAALSRLRRFLVDLPADAPKDRLPALLAAAGLAPDALIPLDEPVRPSGEDTRDALV
jgi:hypothetical protein